MSLHESRGKVCGMQAHPTRPSAVDFPSLCVSVISNTPNSNNSRRLALLVEDSVVSRKLFEYMLKHKGFDVVIATNGQEAVDEFKRHSFDMVLMDIQMPVMDGLKATGLMRQHESESGKHTPIVAITAGMDRGSCMEAGMDGYLEKPVHAPDFHEVLDRVCPEST